MNILYNKFNHIFEITHLYESDEDDDFDEDNDVDVGDLDPTSERLKEFIQSLADYYSQILGISSDDLTRMVECQNINLSTDDSKISLFWFSNVESERTVSADDFCKLADDSIIKTAIWKFTGMPTGTPVSMKNSKRLVTVTCGELKNRIKFDIKFREMKKSIKASGGFATECQEWATAIAFKFFASDANNSLFEKTLAESDDDCTATFRKLQQNPDLKVPDSIANDTRNLAGKSILDFTSQLDMKAWGDEYFVELSTAFWQNSLFTSGKFNQLRNNCHIYRWDNAPFKLHIGQQKDTWNQADIILIDKLVETDFCNEVENSASSISDLNKVFIEYINAGKVMPVSLKKIKHFDYAEIEEYNTKEATQNENTLKAGSIHFGCSDFSTANDGNRSIYIRFFEGAHYWTIQFRKQSGGGLSIEGTGDLIDNKYHDAIENASNDDFDLSVNKEVKVKINGKDTVVKILAASAKAGKPKTILQKILGMESVTDSYTGTQAFKDINNCMNGHTGDDRYFYMVNLCKVCQENVKNGVIQINTPAYRGFAKYIKCMESIIEQGEDGPHRIGNSVQFIYYTLAAVRRENYKDMNSFGPFFKFS